MDKRGQSIVEYTLIAILVILGVVFMGPYVLRSVNAHFKLWDEGVKDSFEEHIRQSPDLPNINSNCKCQATSGACGLSGGQTLCGAGFREIDQNCQPDGCGDATAPKSCISDPTCCDTWVNLGCGNLPCPPTGCPQSGTMAPPFPNNCYYGQQIQVHPCVDTTKPNQPTVQCSFDPACPMPKCVGFSLFANSTYFCTPGPNGPASPPSPGSPGLTENSSYCYAGNGPGSCTTSTACGGKPCAVYCNPPFVYEASKGGCFSPCLSVPINLVTSQHPNLQICNVTLSRQSGANGLYNTCNPPYSGSSDNNCPTGGSYNQNVYWGDNICAQERSGECIDPVWMCKSGKCINPYLPIKDTAASANDIFYYYDSILGWNAPPAAFGMKSVASLADLGYRAGGSGCLAGITETIHGGGFHYIEAVTNQRTIALESYQARWGSEATPFIIVDSENQQFIIGFSVAYQTYYYLDVPMLSGETVTSLGYNPIVTCNAGNGGGVTRIYKTGI